MAKPTNRRAKTLATITNVRGMTPTKAPHIFPAPVPMDWFAAECAHRLIMPEVALEDAEVQQAIKARDADAIESALDNNF